MWRYSYEVLGGVLIFLSSWVTEQIPDKWKRPSWIIFGILAVAYVGVGIYQDKQAVASEQADHQQRDAQTKAIDALSGDSVVIRKELDTVRNQNSAMWKFAQDNLTKEQVGRLFQASAKAVLNTSSTRDSRQKEYELSQRIRKFQADHEAVVQAIEEKCRQEGKMRSPHCGIVQAYDERVEYEKRFLRDYLPQAVSLRDAMLARLPNQPPPDAAIASLLDGSNIDPIALANYLDGLSLSLP